MHQHKQYEQAVPQEYEVKVDPYHLRLDRHKEYDQSVPEWLFWVEIETKFAEMVPSQHVTGENQGGITKLTQNKDTLGSQGSP